MNPSKRSVYRCLTFATALSATTAAFTPSVVAADIPVKSPPVPVTSLSWTGFYVGVHGGWGWRNTHINTPLVSPPFNPTVATSSGPVAGGQIGLNRQHGNVVYGLELDGSWAPVRGNTNRDQTIIVASTQVITLRALATATGRVGYAMGPWFAYAKGGAAWADIKVTTQFTPDITEYARSWYGAAAGAGIEVAFLRNVSAKLEYNFLYFPANHFVWSTGGTQASIDHTFQMVKVGINVRLGDDHVFAR